MRMSELIPTDSEFDRIGQQVLVGARRADRRRTALASVAAAGVLAVGAGGSIAALATANAYTREHTAYCYAAADLGSPSAQVGTPARVVGPDGDIVEAVGATALDMCAAVWRAGVFSADRATPQDPPALALCVRPDGIAAVLPRASGVPAEGFCESLGLGR